MFTPLNLSKLIEEFQKQYDEFPLLDIMTSNQEVRLYNEDIPLLLENLRKDKSFKFVNFFDTNFHLDQKIIKFNNHEIEYKENYDIEKLVELLDDKKIQSLELLSNIPYLKQEEFLNKLITSNQAYISLYTLYYQLKDNKRILKSPLLFLKVKVFIKDNNFYLKLDNSELFYNEVLLTKLYDLYNLDLKYSKSNLNIDDYLTELKVKLKAYSFAIENTISLYDLDINKYLYIDFLLKQKRKGYLENNQIINYFSNKIEINNEPFIFKNNQLDFVKQALNKLNRENVITIHNEDEYEKTFIKQSIVEYILKKQNVIYITKDKDDEIEIKRRLFLSYFDIFMSNKHPFDNSTCILNLLKRSILERSNILNSDLIFKKQEINDLNLEYRNYDATLRNFFSPLEQKDIDFIKDFYFYTNLGKDNYNFPFSEIYSLDSYLKDKDLLDFIKNEPYFQNHNIKNNVFINLSTLLTEDQYDLFIKLISDTIKIFSSLIQVIDSSHIKESGFSDFDKLEDLYKYSYLFDIYLEYPHFKIDYFSLNLSLNTLDKLNKLVEDLKVFASIKLALDMLCNEDIYKENFQVLLKQILDRKEFKNIKNKLKTIIKIKPFKKSLKTLTVLLSKYISYQENINKSQIELENIFKEKIDSLDKALAIQNCCNYIIKYDNFKKSNKFSFNNDFNKLIFKSETYFLEFKNGLEKIDKIKSHLYNIFSKFEIIIPNCDFNFKKETLSNCIEYLNRYLKEDKKFFSIALTYNKYKENITNYLEYALSKTEIYNSLYYDFIISIYKHNIVLLFNNIGGLDFIQKTNDTLNNFYRKNLPNLQNLDIDLLNSYITNKENLISRPSYNQTCQKIKQNMLLSYFPLLNEEMDIASDFLYHLYPLEVLSIKDLYFLKNYKFNLGIIEYDKSISFIDLIYASNLFEKLIVIDKSDIFNKFKFTLNNDIKTYDTFNKLPEFLKERIISAFKRQNIKLEFNKKISDKLTVPTYFENDNNKYLLVVQLESDNLTYQNSYQLNSFLYLNYNIKVVYLYMSTFLIYEDLSIFLLYNQIDFSKAHEYLDMKKYSMLSLEQKKRVDYFSTLTKIDSSFNDYNDLEEYNDEKLIPLRRSDPSKRKIEEISKYEIANGILTYISKFTYLNRNTLINRIAEIIGYKINNIDYIQLFNQASNYLIEEKKIKIENNRYYLIR